MPADERRAGARWWEWLLVVAGFSLLTAILTWPLAIHLESLGYQTHVVGDVQYSIWNVAWVAHALLTDPLHVFDANIFYPHPQTLTYTEANIVAGAIATPVYALTHDPFAANNFAVLASFVLSGVTMYALARYLTGDWRAAAIAGISFACCPYAFAKLPQIQLLMTAGIPLVALAFHRLADAPTPRRGLALGFALAAQVWACAYYAVFVALLTAVLSLVTPAMRRTWSNVRYWIALAIAAAVSGALALPLFLPYLRLQESGFARTLDESRAYSASVRSYLTSATYASGWLTELFPANATSYDVLFPGFVLVIFGVAALWTARRASRERRQLIVLYAAIGAVAMWLSFGPALGLYSLAYQLPVFDFLRAPSRFGILVMLALSVLAALSIADLLKRASAPTFVALALLTIAVLEHVMPARRFAITPVTTIAPAYTFLATQPAGAVLEIPPFSNSREGRIERTRHMINSTAHWFPIVNGYSDFIPPDFSDNVAAYADFPSDLAFSRIPAGVRYVVVTLSHYKGDARTTLESKLDANASRVRRVYADDQTWIYEITRGT